MSNYPTCKCGRFPGSIRWSDSGLLGLTHGFYELVCEACSLERQIAHAEERAAVLPLLREQLATLLEATKA